MEEAREQDEDSMRQERSEEESVGPAVQAQPMPAVALVPPPRAEPQPRFPAPIFMRLEPHDEVFDMQDVIVPIFPDGKGADVPSWDRYDFCNWVQKVCEDFSEEFLEQIKSWDMIGADLVDIVTREEAVKELGISLTKETKLTLYAKIALNKYVEYQRDLEMLQDNAQMVWRV